MANERGADADVETRRPELTPERKTQRASLPGVGTLTATGGDWNGHQWISRWPPIGRPRWPLTTSNRGVDEWLGLFDDPILGNSALDRLANAAHQVVIEVSSYRAKLAPKRREVVAA